MARVRYLLLSNIYLISTIKSCIFFVQSDEPQERKSGSMKSRDGIAVEPDKLSEAFMVQQKDILSHRKVNDRR